VKILKKKIKNSIRGELPKIAMLPKTQFGRLGVNFVLTLTIRNLCFM